jgi:alpha-methylacyl-CoA racemase
MTSASSLKGIRVLDLSQFTPGPYATLMLADLGADVLKIEPPAGDPQRVDGPLDRDGVSAWYKVINRGKRVLKLDLKTPEGREGFTALLRQADILLESFRPGVLDRLGFGREALKGINARLIHCALSGWGQTGPYRLRPGHDINYMAFGGGLTASGTAGTPVITTPSVADFSGGMLAVVAVLAALNRRTRDGAGCYIDVAMAEAVLGWLSIDLTSALRPGFEPKLAANSYNGGMACYQVYRTGDGKFITLGIIEDKFWKNFCDAVGRQDWKPRQWEPFPQHGLIAELAALFLTKTRAEWEKILDPVETCFHSVLDFTELAAHPQSVARSLVFEHRGEDAYAEVLNPMRMDDEVPKPRPALRETALPDAIAAWTR